MQLFWQLVNVQFAVFKSDDPTQPKNQKYSSFNDFATSVYYQAQANNFFSYTVGAGYVKDFRFTNSGWAKDATSNHAVPVANVNGSVTFNKVYTVSAEYNQATSASKY